MDKLPVEITRKIYEYDSTYRDIFKRVLIQLRVNFYVYNCHLCCRPWKSCYCYCSVCKTYLKYCHQIYYNQDDDYEEDDLPDIIPLGFLS